MLCDVLGDYPRGFLRLVDWVSMASTKLACGTLDITDASYDALFLVVDRAD